MHAAAAQFALAMGRLLVNLLGRRVQTASLVAVAAWLGGALPLVAARERPAGPPVYTFQHYGLDQGLTSLSTQVLLQDHAGFLWVGTADGLFRFDGDRFERFGKGEGLPSSFVLQLAETPSGELWAGTLLGLGRRSGERFVTVTLPGTSPYRDVDALAVDCRGRLLVGTAAGAFVQADGDRFEALFPGAAGWRTRGFAVDCARDRVWIGGERRLASWDGSTLSTYTRGLEDATRLDSLAVDLAGRLWLRSPEHLYRLDPGRGVPERDDDGLPAASDYAALLLDRRGELWVPTDVGLAHRRDLRWEVLGKKNGLAGDAAKAVLEDREGSLWVGNDADGLDRWVGRGVWQAYDQATGLSHDVVWGALRDGDGALWVATQDGLDRLSPDGATWRRYGREDGLDGAFVLALALDARGDLWIGTADGGLSRLRRGAARAEAIGRELGLRTGGIAALAIDPEHRLWIASTRGLFEVDLESAPLRGRQVELPGTQRDALGDPFPETLYSVVRDRRGLIWAAGRFGLAVGDGRRWRRLTPNDGLRDLFTSYLALDGGGDVWVAYRDEFGISRLRLEGADFLTAPLAAEHRGRVDGLASDVVYFLGADTAGRLWVGTALGLDVLTAAGVRHYGRGEGMLSGDTCSNAFFADRDRTLWIGTPRGLLHAQLDALERPSAAGGTPDVQLTEITLGGVGRALDRRGQVPSSGGTLHARFTAPSFAGRDQLRFRYLLEGLDPSPTETREREITYRGLAPGRYQLVLDARLAGGEWSARPATYAFTVEPLWWQSWATRILLALAGAAALLLLERHRLRVLRRRARALEEAVAERTREAREASMTDPLTGARNRRYFQEVVPADAQRVLRHHRSGDHRRNDDLVFCLVDLDHFKQVNDRYGHRVGDEVLRECARRLQDSLRDPDLLFRWGGEEFLVLFRDCERGQGDQMASRLVRAIRREPLRVGAELALELTCSVGWALYPWSLERPDGLTAQEVVDLADAALYAAKRQGRDRAASYEPREASAAPDVAVREALQSGHEIASAHARLRVWTEPRVATVETLVPGGGRGAA